MQGNYTLCLYPDDVCVNFLLIKLFHIHVRGSNYKLDKKTLFFLTKRSNATANKKSYPRTKNPVKSFIIKFAFRASKTYKTWDDQCFCNFQISSVPAKKKLKKNFNHVPV